MSEYTEVEQPFLHQLASQGWTIIDQGREIPQDPSRSLRQTFRQWLLPEVFAKAVSAINTTATGEPWLTDKQLHDRNSGGIPGTLYLIIDQGSNV